MSMQADVGDAMPTVAMTGADGQAVTIGDFAGQPLVVFFYPKDDTPGCTIENQDFSNLGPDFAKAGVALLGVSKDPPARHAKFVAKYCLVAPLASDAESADGIGGLSDALGIWLEKSMYGRTYMGMERTTYLVDAAGKIARVWRKVKVKGHAAEVLEAAQNL